MGGRAGVPRRIGWFGKLPASGDFLARRVEPATRQRLDDWLQASLTASRRELGDGWLDAFLTAPIWRFVLHGAAGGASAGLLMPSVDKVGRYFPFALLVEFDGPLAGDALSRADRFLSEIEPDALHALEEGFDADALDHRLALKLRAARRENEEAAVAASTLDPGPDENGEAWPATFWWTAGSEGNEAAFLRCEDMPPPSRFALFLRDPDPDDDLAATWKAAREGDANSNGPLDGEWSVGAFRVHVLAKAVRADEAVAAHAAQGGTGALAVCHVGAGERRARASRFAALALLDDPTDRQAQRVVASLERRGHSRESIALLLVSPNGTTLRSGSTRAVHPAGEAVGGRLIVAPDRMASLVEPRLAEGERRDAAATLREDALIAGLGDAGPIVVIDPGPGH